MRTDSPMNILCVEQLVEKSVKCSLVIQVKTFC
uniref:Uncharacterized protein n=1 Tax=Anguilla anguilla TaxID=7936 RepID=A0A0E9T6F9_ANGAN